MATYVVGDIQGCYKGLTQLLKTLQFRPNKDKLIAVGDIVARGEDSLSVVQYCHDLGENFSMVLGNHDLHLLAIHAGLRKAKDNDKLGKLLKHSEIDHYIDWLRAFPLVKTWKKIRSLLMQDFTLCGHSTMPNKLVKKSVNDSQVVNT